MAHAAISMIGSLALLMVLALNFGMFQRRWAQFHAALRNQSVQTAAPMSPPAETNIVMLRPAGSSALSRPVPRLALAA